MSDAKLTKVEHTRPYISLFVFRELAGFKVTDFFADLVTLCGIGIDGGRRFIVSEGPASPSYRYCHYIEQRRPGWILPEKDPEILDRTNHLLLIVRSEKYLAIHATESGAKGAIERRAT